MGVKVLKTFGVISLLAFLVISVAFGREMNFNNRYPVQDTVQAASPAATPVPYKLSDKINAGIELLRKTSPLAYETKSIRLKNGKLLKTNDLARKQIALVILDVNAGNIFEKRVWVKEDEIKNFKKTGLVNLSSADNIQLEIRPRQWNSFNTFHEIAGHPEMVVIANKYLVASNLLGSLPERSKSRYSEVIYSPYSLALSQPEIIESGRNYLEKSANSAFEQLERIKVQSKSLKGQLVTQVVTKDFVKNIILVEHIDPDSFTLASDGGKELTERILTIIGANQNLAYRYTGSPAGAFGLAQFIRPTYRTITAKYPEAGLVKDYTLGMADHVNAVKAMVLFFDLYKWEMENKIARPEIVKQLGITEEMLAAAYNGGPNRVVKSVNRYGLAWLSQQFKLPKSQRNFKNETLEYLQKLRSVKRLNIF